MSIEEAQTRLIRLAAEMATGKGMSSEFHEDHGARRSRSYWLRQIEKDNMQAKRWAQDVKAVYDLLTPMRAQRRGDAK